MQEEKTLSLLDVIKNFDSDSFIALLKSKHGFSNDESFLDFHGYNYFDLQSHCEELREVVHRGLDIPTSIGIAPTKTLCKVANKIAKKYILFI